MGFRIDMEQVKKQAIDALRQGFRRVCIAGKWFPIRFIHDNGCPQYGLMSPYGEILRLVVHGPEHIEALLAC